MGDMGGVKNLKKVCDVLSIMEKSPLLDWPNLGKAHALVPYRFRGTCKKYFYCIFIRNITTYSISVLVSVLADMKNSITVSYRYWPI